MGYFRNLFLRANESLILMNKSTLMTFFSLLSLIAVAGRIRAGDCGRRTVSLHFRDRFDIPRIITGK